MQDCGYVKMVECDKSDGRVEPGKWVDHCGGVMMVVWISLVMVVRFQGDGGIHRKMGYGNGLMMVVGFATTTNTAKQRQQQQQVKIIK